MGSAAEIVGSVLGEVTSGRDLSADRAGEFLGLVMRGEVAPLQLAAVLAALRTKGESVSEITGFARAMRENAVPVPTRRTGLVDTCGTGGDGAGTFNISTACALLTAALDVPVAKHGNRAVSSRCGSADVLEALGVNVDLDAAQAGALVDEVGVGFLFAPRLHPAMKHAAEARRGLGVRTVFNILGPLTNPAGARRQLLGVFDPDLCEPLARVLGELGSERAFVVHGAGGLDEVSPLGPTRVAELAGGEVTVRGFRPEDAGIAPCRAEDLAGGGPAENAAIITAVLDGESGPRTDAVLLNTGFTAVLAGLAGTPAAGVELARAAIADGRAAAKLDQLREASQRLREAS